MLKGESDRRFHELETGYYIAWHSGLFSQSYAKGKFPKYDRHAPKRKRIRRAVAQSWQQQKMVLKALTAAMGGTFTKRSD